MSIPLKQLTDSDGSDFFPITTSEGVKRPDGNTIESALANIPTKNSQLENDSNFVYTTDKGKTVPVQPDIPGNRIMNKAITEEKVDLMSFSKIMVRGVGAGTEWGGNKRLQLTTVSVKIGDRLTASGGGVVIGDGVKYVRVSACVFYEDSSIDYSYGWARIEKNGNDTGFNAIANLGSFNTATIASVLIPVAKGDLITTCNIDPAKIRCHSSWMTVEQIG